MRLNLNPAQLAGAITPPPSKSQAHRLLLAAALAAGRSEVHNLSLSKDIEATIGCMRALGARITLSGGAAVIEGIGGRAFAGGLPEMDCNESGSTLRFLIPIALGVAGGGVFRGRGRLMQRPQEPYFAIFREKGIAYTQEADSLTVSGRLTPGDYALPGDVSSQFVTGLLYALSLLPGDSTLTITSRLESASYVDMTLDALRCAGVMPRQTTDEAGHLRYEISGGGAFRAFSRTVEPDWSQAGFWYAARTMGSDLEIDALRADSAQGDRVAADYFAALAGEGEVTLDVSDCPDLVPALAVCAALRAEQVTRIVGAARLRMKESDRLAAVTQELNALGAVIEEFPDALTIRGVSTLHGGCVDSHNDHRIAMMLAVAATRADGEITLSGAESVAKSYPDFWEKYAALGGSYAEAEA